jgi:uncharacterized protein
VSIGDDDVPRIVGHRRVIDAHLLTLARRHGVCFVTFDAAVIAFARAYDVELRAML